MAHTKNMCVCLPVVVIYNTKKEEVTTGLLNPNQEEEEEHRLTSIKSVRFGRKKKEAKITGQDSHMSAIAGPIWNGEKKETRLDV